MQFTVRKRRSPPAVIIISLIDVLIVVLIFLMVTSTFKKQPAVKLVLPESKQAKSGATENALIITVEKSGMLLFGADPQPVTVDRLQEKLLEAVRKNPESNLSINADKDAPFGQIIKVMDVAKAANIKAVSAFTKGAGK
jgi:biopolymer transport protein ExbD